MTAVKKGKFITLEGIEGVGKTTNLQFIKQAIEKRGIEVVTTREPGGTPLAEDLRGLLLKNWDEQIHPDTELLLMFASRSQHVNEVILPALSEGKWVLSDRFTEASFAYQGYGRGIALHKIQQLEQLVQGDLRPDMTFLLDAPVGIGRTRMDEREGAPDRIEQEKLEFFERVRQGYLAQAKTHSSRFACIDASLALDEVQKSIAKVLDTVFAGEESLCND